MFPPYDKVEFLAAGGVAEDRADKDTPASAAAGARRRASRRPALPTRLPGVALCLLPDIRLSCSRPPPAEVIELTGGEGATWREVGPMPYSRVMGDAGEF